MNNIHGNQSSPTIVSMTSGSMSVQVPQPIEEEVHTSPHSVQSHVESILQEIVQEV
jgi:hypothetical protein